MAANVRDMKGASREAAACAEIQELMLSAAAGEAHGEPISLAVNRKIEAHVRRCDFCLHTLTAADGPSARAEEMLRTTLIPLPSEAEWDRMRAPLLSELAAEEEKRGTIAEQRPPIRMSRGAPLWLSTAAAALLFVLVFFVVGAPRNRWGPSGAPEMTMAAEVEILEIPDDTSCMVTFPEESGEAVVVWVTSR